VKKAPVTVIMLTLNEEFHLPRAIENVKDWADEIFIVDSCSTDRTVDIALEHSVNIVQRPFTNFGDQWNFALEKLPIRSPWTFMLAPDERLTPELKAEISATAYGNSNCSAYSVKWRLWFMGKPLHVWAPVLRLWRTGKCHISNVIVNEHPIIEGPVGKLKAVLEHYDRPSLHEWFEKQNRYSTMEAIMRITEAPLSTSPRLLGTVLERRMFFKKIFRHVPLRFQLLWIYNVLVRGAWLDGWRGLAWARLQVEKERAIELKFVEMKTTGYIPEMAKTEDPRYDPRVLSSKLQELALK
jgi:glycosyltransferase involved in cell wall biosynthesis